MGKTAQLETVKEKAAIVKQVDSVFRMRAIDGEVACGMQKTVRSAGCTGYAVENTPAVTVTCVV